MHSPLSREEERVLVVAPTARDAQLSYALFTRAGLACAVCSDLVDLSGELARGAGAIVLTEEALAPGRRELLGAALAGQPTWSSLPIILLASTGTQQALGIPFVQQLGTVLVLERPISTQTLLSVVQMALRTRHRQYQARLVAEAGQLLTTSHNQDESLAAIAALLVPRLADCCLIYTLDGDMLHAAAMRFVPEAAPVEAALRGTLDGMPLSDTPTPAVGAAPPARVPGYGGAATSTAERLAEAHLGAVGASVRLVMPLVVREQLLGVISLGMLGPGRAFPDDDRQVVQEVAERLALALNQTRLYRAEQAARAEAEAAVRSRDELMALISHDLNNPLTAVLGQTALLLRKLANGKLAPEQLLRGLTNVERAGRQIQAQIAELLDAARLRAGQPLVLHVQATDLVALAQAVASTARQGTEQHEISVQTEPPALVIPVDPVRIGRVFDNLLSNAVKYSPDGGRITVSIFVEPAEAGSWAVIQVRDQGIGIPADDLPHVFEPFRRAANVQSTTQGTGLGLASARQIVEQHGGQISAASPPNGGTCLTVRLPL